MQSHLITPLDTRYIEGPLRQIVSPFAWYSARYNVTGCAPIGFVYDGASIPRLPIAYWLFGGTADLEALPHDLGYRWQFKLTRWQWDLMFYEMAGVRHRGMVKQALIRRVWRGFSKRAMTGAVMAFGWFAFNRRPGALDIRPCKKCIKPGCEGCNNFYEKWKDCLLTGYRPDIVLKHGG